MYVCFLKPFYMFVKTWYLHYTQCDSDRVCSPGDMLRIYDQRENKCTAFGVTALQIMNVKLVFYLKNQRGF